MMHSRDSNKNSSKYQEISEERRISSLEKLFPELSNFTQLCMILDLVSSNNNQMKDDLDVNLTIGEWNSQ